MNEDRLHPELGIVEKCRECPELVDSREVVATPNRRRKNRPIPSGSRAYAGLVAATRCAVVATLLACSAGGDSISVARSDPGLEEVGRGEPAEEVPSRTVTDFLEALPTETWFYFLVGALVFGLAARHWFLARSLKTSIRDYKSNKDNKVSDLDWGVIGELRQRALRLRARSNWILFLVLALLFGGLYVVFFVLYQVLENERLQEERLRSEVFKARFAEQLEGLVRGVHWVEVDGAKFRLGIDDGPGERTPPAKLMEGPMQPRGAWTGVGLSSDGSIALLGEGSGDVWVKRASREHWIRADLELRAREWVSHAAFSADGERGLVVGDEGSVVATEDGGNSWLRRPQRVRLRSVFSSVVVSGDGAVGLATDVGSVLATRDAGKTWTSVELDFEPGEVAAYAALSVDGMVGLVVGDQGSVVTTGNGGGTWIRRNPSGSLFAISLSAAGLSDDGSVGLVAGGAAAFLTRDNGATWIRTELPLGPGENVAYVGLSADGRRGLIVGEDGAVLRTGDAGDSWAPVDLSEQFTGELSAVVLSGSGLIGLVADGDGLVMATRDAGETWTQIRVGLVEDESVAYAGLSASGERGLIVGTAGSVLTSENEGRDWRAAQAELPPIASSATGQVALVRDHEDHLFLTDDAGEKWQELSFRLPGRLTAVAVDLDGRTVVVANDQGSGYVSWNAGRRWEPTAPPEGDLDIAFLESPVRILATSMPSPRWSDMGAGGEQFVLERHTALAGWQSRSSSSILDALRQSSTLQNSEIHRSMRQFLVDYDARASLDARELESAPSTAASEKRTSLGEVFSDLRIIQAATLTILFFLVQTLSRLHRYSLRLAAFWESRADAVLLAQGRPEMQFEELVRSFAPDTYDFRSSPQAALQSLLFRKKA